MHPSICVVIACHEQLQQKIMCTVPIVCNFAFTFFFTIILILRRHLAVIVREPESETRYKLFGQKGRNGCNSRLTLLSKNVRICKQIDPSAI